MNKIFKFNLIFKLLISIVILCFINTSFALVQTNEFTTKSGIQVVLVTDKTTDLISISMAFTGAGSISDPLHKCGLSFTAMEMLYRGKIDGLNRHKRIRKLIKLGVLYGINLNISYDNLYINFKTPKENFTKTLQEVNKILMFRDFDIDDLNNIKTYIPQNTNINMSEETAFANKVLLNKVFPEHPYGNPINGMYDDKQTLTKTDLINYLDNSLAKDNLYISVVGDINQKQLEKVIDTTFSNLPKNTKLAKLPKPKLILNGDITTMYKDSPQSGASFIQDGIQTKHKDYYALVTLLDILSAKPFTSRLWYETREKRGIVYDIGADLQNSLKNKAFIIGRFKCDNDNVQTIIDIIRNEWRKIKEKGVSNQEFEDAKTGLIGSYALNFTTPESICSYLLFLKLQKINVDFIKNRNKKIKSLTLKDVNAATKYLTPEKLTFVIVGKPQLGNKTSINTKKNTNSNTNTNTSANTKIKTDTNFKTNTKTESKTKPKQ